MEILRGYLRGWKVSPPKFAIDKKTQELEEVLESRIRIVVDIPTEESVVAVLAGISRIGESVDVGIESVQRKLGLEEGTG